MGIVNKRNAIVGWLTLKVGKRVVRKKAQQAAVSGKRAGRGVIGARSIRVCCARGLRARGAQCGIMCGEGGQRRIDVQLHPMGTVPIGAIRSPIR